MYYQKYIKYKSKYLNFKKNKTNQQGGELCLTNNDVFQSDLSKKYKKLISSASNFFIPPNSSMFNSKEYFDHGTTYTHWNKVSLLVLEQLLQELEIYRNKDASFNAKRGMVMTVKQNMIEIKKCLNKKYSDIKLVSIVNNVSNINGITLGVPKNKFSIVEQITLEFWEKLLRWGCKISCPKEEDILDSPLGLFMKKNSQLNKILSPITLTPTTTLTSTDFTVSFSPSNIPSNRRSSNYIPDYSTNIPGFNMTDISNDDLDDIIDQLEHSKKNIKKKPSKYEPILKIFREYPDIYSEHYLRLLSKKLDKYTKDKTINVKDGVVLTWSIIKKDNDMYDDVTLDKNSVKINDLVNIDKAKKIFLKFLKKYKKNSIYVDILSNNKKQIKFYKTHGFKTIGMTTLEENDALILKK
tara:strand:- start:4703 stop:5932 length:1230 start_codon:yes stop_codon:yes gene_type:complete